MNQSRHDTRESADSLARRKAQEEPPQPRTDAPSYTLLRLQRAAGNRAVVRLLESSAQLRTKSKDQGAGDEYEREADRAAAQALNLSPAPRAVVQHKCAACATGTPCSSCADEEEELVQRKEKGAPLLTDTGLRVQLASRENAPATPPASATPAAERPEASTSAGPLIVEDEAAELTTGQMRKSDFLAELRAAACSAADEALASAGRDTRGCPYIERGFDSYAGRPAAYIERGLRKYAPEAATATSAREYIPVVSERVRRGVTVWAETGEVTGVPQELAGMISGGGLLGGIGALGAMIGGAVSGLVSGIGAAVSGLAGAVGGALSGVGRALFKKKENAGAAAADEPERAVGELSNGRPLDGGLRSRMGAAFNHDFAGVRVHTDAQAASLSDGLSARAFTVGSDIAFGAGEYRPGTLIGDALIAHELAHVVQQGGGGAVDGPMQKGEAEGSSLEEEADTAAVGVMLNLHGGVGGELAGLGVGTTMPRLRSGLRLQRCGSCGASKPPQIKVPFGSAVTEQQADQLLANDPLIAPRIKDRVAAGRKATGHTTELGTEDYLYKAKEKVYEGFTNPRTNREYTLEDVSFDLMNAGGFAHEGEIYLHRKDVDYLSISDRSGSRPMPVPPARHPATIVHEAVHLYGAEAWRRRVGRAGNEGTTEYFTRRVLSKQKNPEVEGGVVIFQRDSYPDEFEAVKCLVSKSNDELLADAYFLGTLDPLINKVGAPEFNAWATAMQNDDYAAAHAALGCAAPPKKKEQE
jgi:hypothetical protein